MLHSRVEFVWVEWNYVRTFPSIQLNYRLGKWCIDNNGNGVCQSRLGKKFREFSTFVNWFYHKYLQKVHCKLQVISMLSSGRSAVHIDSNTCSIRSNHVHVHEMMFDNTRPFVIICKRRIKVHLLNTKTHNRAKHRENEIENSTPPSLRTQSYEECAQCLHIGIRYLQCDYDIGLNIQIR